MENVQEENKEVESDTPSTPSPDRSRNRTLSLYSNSPASSGSSSMSNSGHVDLSPEDKATIDEVMAQDAAEEEAKCQKTWQHYQIRRQRLENTTGDTEARLTKRSWWMGLNGGRVSRDRGSYSLGYGLYGNGGLGAYWGVGGTGFGGGNASWGYSPWTRKWRRRKSSQSSENVKGKGKELAYDEMSMLDPRKSIFMLSCFYTKKRMRRYWHNRLLVWGK